MGIKKFCLRATLAVVLVSLMSIPSFAAKSEQFTFKDGRIICSCSIDYIEHMNQLKILNLNTQYLDCECGGTIFSEKVYEGSWLYTGNSKRCTDQAYGHDYELKQTVITRFKCIRCIIIWEEDTYNRKWECKGF